MATVDMDTLVDSTSGLQPWRRVMHATNGVLVALALTVLPISRGWAVALLLAALAAQGGLDLVRLRWPKVNAAFFSVFRHVASPREATGVASSTWYTMGLVLAVAIFPREAAVTGILVLALADPAASYVGRRWGRRPLLGASLEGTAAFATVAFLVLAARHDLATALVGAAASAVAERLSWPLDDNLTIPVAAAAVVTLMGRIV